MRGIGSYRSTWHYRGATAAVIAQAVIGTGTLIWHWRLLPPQVPLWYSRPWGNDRLAEPIFLTVPILLSIIIYVSNLAAISKFAGAHPMFARILLMTSIFVSALSCVMVVRIVTLVT